MKVVKSAATILVLFAFLSSGPAPAAKKKEPPPPEKISGNIIISGAFALYPMVVKWKDEFEKIHPDVVIDVSAGGAGKGMADVLSNMVDIGMVSRDIHPEEITKGAWFVAVAKDAVVVIVNDKNPALKDIMTLGLRKEGLVDAWVTGKAKTWGDILDKTQPYPLNVYTRSDACGAGEVWAKFLGKNQEDLRGDAVYGDPGISQAVKLDGWGIGYNNINFAYDAKTRKPVPGIAVAPIDLDGNGKIDPDENFYGTLDSLDKAIAEGRYPSPPARELYFVTNGKPQKKQVVEFLKWVLTDGQKLVPEAGYIPLSAAKLQEQIDKLPQPAAQQPKKK
jgi:phosphate transport system substrate-binding protein